MLAPDLIPHYLGKTPKIVRTRRESSSSKTTSKLQVPKFDASQFKIPALPTPTNENMRFNGFVHGSKTTTNDAHPPRGRSLKTLEISAETLTRHDEEILKWLTAQKLSPEDLAYAGSLDKFDVGDREKLRSIVNDEGFFRRKGLFPPVSSDAARSMSRSDLHQKPSGGHVPEDERPRRSVSRNSQMSLDKTGSDRSSTTLRGQRIDSRNWQTTSSTGILSAWRDICQRQDSLNQNQALNIEKPPLRSRTESIVSSQHEPMLWHEGVSFSQKSEDRPRATPDIDASVIDANEKYWAPIRSFPMPDGPPRDQNERRSTVVAMTTADTRHRRRHSRQASLVRRPRQTSEQPHQRTPRGSRQQTPVSAVSSHRSTSRRPVNAGREGGKAARASVEPEVASVKPIMVDSQVQTTDELMSFLMDEPSAGLPDTPTISKDRRKRPGCFSALDEDMEDIFGPYSDVPLKRTRIEEEDEVLSRPRVTLLREDDEVKKLRAQQREERAAMPPPATIDTSSDKAPLESKIPFGFASANPGLSKGTGPSSTSFKNIESETDESPNLSGLTADKQTNSAILSAPVASTFPANSSLADSGEAIKPASFSFGKPASAPIAKANSPEAPKTFPSFDFGHTPKAPVAETSAASVTEAPKFTFGTTAKVDAKTVVESKPAEEKITSKPFIFGDNTDPKNDTFGQLPAKETTASKPFTFGKSADSSTGTSSAVSSTTPAFGGFSTNNATSGFSFGTSTTPKEVASNTPIGSSQVDTLEPPSTFGDQVNKSTPQFSFGSTSSALPAGNQAQKSASETSKTASPFSFGQTSKDPAASSMSFGVANTAEEPKANSTKSQFNFGSTADTLAGKSEQPATSTFSFGKKDPGSVTQGQDGSTSSFGFGGTKSDMGQVKANAAPSQPAFGGFGFGGAVPVPASTPGFGTATSQPENKAPAFAFGNSEVGNKPAPFSFGNNTTNAGSNAASPAPMFGSPNVAVSGSNGFGSPAPISNTTPAFSFGQTASPAPSMNSFATGAASNNETNVTSSGLFGSKPAQDPAPAFGTTSTSAPSFSFGASAPGTNSGFSFGASNPAANSTTSTNAFAFGQNVNAQNTQPANATPFQFGAQPAAQAGTQPFAFGQPQSGTNSGFNSPAAVSPSIQSAAPGSPNPFNFGAAPAAAPGSGQGGARKIMQPRSRRPRPGAGR